MAVVVVSELKSQYTESNPFSTTTLVDGDLLFDDTHSSNMFFSTQYVQPKLIYNEGPSPYYHDNSTQAFPLSDYITRGYEDARRLRVQGSIVHSEYNSNQALNTLTGSSLIFEFYFLDSINTMRREHIYVSINPSEPQPYISWGSLSDPYAVSFQNTNYDSFPVYSTFDGQEGGSGGSFSVRQFIRVSNSGYFEVDLTWSALWDLWLPPEDANGFSDPDVNFNAYDSSNPGGKLRGFKIWAVAIPPQADGGKVKIKDFQIKCNNSESTPTVAKITDEDNNEIVSGDSIDFGQYGGATTTGGATSGASRITEQVSYHNRHFTDLMTMLSNNNSYSSLSTPLVHSLRNTLSNTADESSSFLLTGRAKMEYIYFIPPHPTTQKYSEIFGQPIGSRGTINVYKPTDLSTDLYNSQVLSKTPVLVKVTVTSEITNFFSFLNVRQKINPFGFSYKYVLASALTKFSLERQQTVSNGKTVCLFANTSKTPRDISVYLSTTDVRIVRDVKNLGLYIPKYGINTIRAIKPFVPLEITRNADTGSAAEVNIPAIGNREEMYPNKIFDNYPVNVNQNFKNGNRPLSDYHSLKPTHTYFTAYNKRTFGKRLRCLEQLYQSYIIFPEGIMTGLPANVKYIVAELLGAVGNNVELSERGKPCIYGMGYLDRTKNKTNIDAGKNDAFAIQFYNIKPTSSRLPTGATLPKMAFIRLKFCIDQNETDFYERTTSVFHHYAHEQHQIYPITSAVKTNYAFTANSSASHNNHALKMVGDADGVGSFATGFSGSSQFNADGTLNIESNTVQYAYVISQCDWLAPIIS